MLVYGALGHALLLAHLPSCNDLISFIVEDGVIHPGFYILYASDTFGLFGHV